MKVKRLTAGTTNFSLQMPFQSLMVDAKIPATNGFDISGIKFDAVINTANGKNIHLMNDISLEQLILGNSCDAGIAHIISATETLPGSVKCMIPMAKENNLPLDGDTILTITVVLPTGYTADIYTIEGKVSDNMAQIIEVQTILESGKDINIMDVDIMLIPNTVDKIVFEYDNGKTQELGYYEMELLQLEFNESVASVDGYLYSGYEGLSGTFIAVPVMPYVKAKIFNTAGFTSTIHTLRTDKIFKDKASRVDVKIQQSIEQIGRK